MLVQQNDPKPPKNPLKTQSFSPSTCFSLNLHKTLLVTLSFATIVSVFLLRNGSVDPSSLLCLQTQVQEQKKIEMPKIEWHDIKKVVDVSTPFSNFKSEKWVVIYVSEYPTDLVKNLVKLKGWQVLAIGGKNTPLDWELKGTIFLSFEQQVKLGFKVFEYLPFDSYVRKNIGYLFAIQHGAKMIFDADVRGEVLGSDISTRFDVDLSSDISTRFDVDLSSEESILQYSNENLNRTIVNPYIHFGQRSVWPRGLPLENVGEIAHEEYYTKVFGGKQFIQQGVSNGLPDVDSVFYSTRKSDSEPFDVWFDEHAPKVALPQGLMVPLNSFNTLFHSSAFWGLMLPVGVSTMALDVLRGYWAQRMLWEIGGYVVVYPPTVHRDDNIEAYPFSQEKDLHVNVGRLIKFLISWRSEKHSLFDKILELSFVMAEEGFWGEREVEFTAAWLQDLVAVGYMQPRVMSLELDVHRPLIGHGDTQEFIPRKLPSKHLGVEESGTVNYEIGNLIRWRRNFGNVVLIMFCNGPVERTALEWRLLYGRIFKTVVILSTKKNEGLAVEESDLDHLYKHLPTIFERYNSAEGFLILHDDTLLNYWSLVHADKSKLWITNKVSKSWTSIQTSDKSDWNKKQLQMVNKVVNIMPAHLQVNYKESVTADNTLTICSSEVFYVPRQFVSDFVDLVNLVGDLDIHQKAAIPMFFLAMGSPQNYDPVFSTMVYKRKPPSSNSTTYYSAEKPAIHPWKVSSEKEFLNLIRLMAAGDPLLMELI